MVRVISIFLVLFSLLINTTRKDGFVKYELLAWQVIALLALVGK